MQRTNYNQGKSATNQTKINVSVMLPGLLELTAVDPDFPWDSIDRTFAETWAKKVAESGGETFRVEASFFFMLLAALKDDSLAIGYVDYLNRTCQELSDHLTTEQKKMLGGILKKILKTPNLNFLNFVGELATLNNLLKSNNYELQRIESPLNNDNSIDFRIKDLKTGNPILVEVLNMQVNDDKVEADPKAIEAFFTRRLVKKIAAKEEELAGTIDFWVVAVVWGGWRSIEIYRNHFREHQLPLKRTIEPLAYLQHSDGRGYYMHQFGRISTMRIVDGDTVP